MPRPEGYAEIPAHEESIQQAREVKESVGLTWNKFLKLSAEKLSDETNEQSD
jgi:hypothetical protein